MNIYANFVRLLRQGLYGITVQKNPCAKAGCGGFEENRSTERFSLERKNALEKIYANIASPASSLPGQRDFGRRRVLNSVERRYLSPEAQSVAYCLMNAGTASPDITEKTIQQAVVLGSLSGIAVDAPTFEALFEAVTLDPSFRIPFPVTTSLNPSSAWIC